MDVEVSQFSATDITEGARRALRKQIFGLVRPTFGAQLDVMDIEKARVSAAGHAAAPLVAQQHGAA